MKTVAGQGMGMVAALGMVLRLLLDMDAALVQMTRSVQGTVLALIMETMLVLVLWLELLTEHPQKERHVVLHFTQALPQVIVQPWLVLWLVLLIEQLQKERHVVLHLTQAASPR
jgi:hypothetical protein